MEEFKEIIMEKNNNLMSGKGEKGEWKTINGAHVYVEDGQSVEEAMNKQFNKKDNGKRWNETGLHNSEKQPSKSHTLSDSDKTIVDDAIYWAQKEGKGNVKGAMEQLEADMAGFLSYGEKGNYEAVRDYMREKLGDSDSSDKVAASIDQDKIRDDKYTTGNPDNINKQSSTAEIENTLKGYKGSGSVDLVLPGGKWAQIRPQKDGTYLVRSNKGSKYVGTVDEAKKAVAGDFVSPEQAKAYATGGGHLSENGGYQGVSNVDSAPKFEYKSTASEYSKGAKFTNPAGVEFEVVDTSTNKQGVEYVKLKDASGEFEIEKAQLDRLGWLSKFSK